jgi:hypothetical protein
MRTTMTAVYAAFERAGFLTPASWQPSAVGAAAVPGAVRFLRSTVQTFEGQAKGIQLSITLPASQWPAIRKGELVTLLPPDAAPEAYRVHEVDLINGGSQRYITLKR